MPTIPENAPGAGMGSFNSPKMNPVKNPVSKANRTNFTSIFPFLK